MNLRLTLSEVNTVLKVFSLFQLFGLNLRKPFGVKKAILIFSLIVIAIVIAFPAMAQCSICTKTAQQLGEGPAKGLNSGILYLAFTPFAIAGFVAFRWWKNNRTE